MRSTRLIAGVDGSPQSRQALRWATAEAARRGGTLHVVPAFPAVRALAAHVVATAILTVS